MKIAAASNGAQALAVIETRTGQLYLNRYAPSSFGNSEHAAEFKALFTRAASKLGWKPDRRCKCGWRKVAQ
jgi:hypothetical protein